MMYSELNNRVSSWHPNSLHRRESMSSIVAKFCISNSLSPAQFSRTLVELRGGVKEEERLWAGANECWTLRKEGPEIDGLASLLGEDRELVGTATLSDFPQLSRWHQLQLNSKYPEKKRLRMFCPACLTEGYHSVFHQVAWLTSCPVHKTRLHHVGPPQDPKYGRKLKYLPHDTSLALFLYRQWKPQANRKSWWGIDVRTTEFGKRVNCVARNIEDRWRALSQSNDLMGSTLASFSPLTLDEAEILSGIRADIEPDVFSRPWAGRHPELVTLFVPLSQEALIAILQDSEEFDAQLERSFLNTWELQGLQPDQAALSERVRHAQSMVDKAINAGHESCMPLQPSPRQGTYAWHHCRGVQRMQVWKDRRFVPITTMSFFLAKPARRAGIDTVVDALIEAVEWAWAHAIFSTHMSSQFEMRCGIHIEVPGQIARNWYPRFSVQIVEGGLQLRMLCYAPLKLPALNDPAEEAKHCISRPAVFTGLEQRSSQSLSAAAMRLASFDFKKK